jgi:hypothetical protein
MGLPIFASLKEMMEYYYGPSRQIRKAVEVSETAGSGTHWEPLYGKKVWSWLNLESNVFAILPKEPWTQSGWRILTTRAHSSGGGIAESTDGGTVPTPLTLTFAQIKTKPKTVVHTFDLGELAEFLGSVDDAVDLLPTYREEIGKEHASCINKMLIGDADTVAGDNFESLDRVIAAKSEITGGRYSANDLDIYGLDRDSPTTYDAYVSHNSNTDRDLSLSIIDTVLQNVWDNGGLPKVILTKTDSMMRWQQLLEAERRFMDTARVVPTFGGVRGPAPGIEAGFLVATYFGIPIIPSIDVPACSTIGGIYFIDTDFVKFAVAKPTTYAETGKGEGFLYRGKFATEGMYETMGELRAYRFNAHGKVADLK